MSPHDGIVQIVPPVAKQLSIYSTEYSLIKLMIMKTLILGPLSWAGKKYHYIIIAMLMLILVYQLIPTVLSHFEPGTAVLDGAIWQLLAFSFITFLSILIISWYLLHFVWNRLSLPGSVFMVSQFKTLSPWQQLSFYYASFALLILAAVGCLVAVF